MSVKAPDAMRILGTQAMPVVDRHTLHAAKAAWAEHRSGPCYDFKAVASRLLSPPSASAKLKKTGEYGLVLAQADLSGYNVCRWSTRWCRADCLGFAGRMGMDEYAPNGGHIKKAQKAKTTFLIEHPQEFLTLLIHELSKLENGTRVRLNVLSDIAWELVTPWLFDLFPYLKFYDYTKGWMRGEDNDLPANYRLTYSVSEKVSVEDAYWMTQTGSNVAIVVRRQKSLPFPEDVTLDGFTFKAVDGDKSDNRYDDAPGVAVFLRPKGTMRKSGSPMVKG